MSADSEIATPLSGLELVEQRAAESRAALDELLDQSSIRHDDINDRLTEMVVVAWNPWQWDAASGPCAAGGEARSGGDRAPS